MTTTPMTDTYLKEVSYMSADLARIEAKVDRVAEAINQLVRVEERQIGHSDRLNALEARTTTVEEAQRATDRELSKWINRGIGMWALAVFVWTAYLAIKPMLA